MNAGCGRYGLLSPEASQRPAGGISKGDLEELKGNLQASYHLLCNALPDVAVALPGSRAHPLMSFLSSSLSSSLLLSLSFRSHRRPFILTPLRRGCPRGGGGGFLLCSMPRHHPGILLRHTPRNTCWSLFSSSPPFLLRLLSSLFFLFFLSNLSLLSLTSLSLSGSLYSSRVGVFLESMRSSYGLGTNVNFTLVDVEGDFHSSSGCRAFLFPFPFPFPPDLPQLTDCLMTGRVVMFDTQHEYPYASPAIDEEVTNAVTTLLDLPETGIVDRSHSHAHSLFQFITFVFSLFSA